MGYDPETTGAAALVAGAGGFADGTECGGGICLHLRHQGDRLHVGGYGEVVCGVAGGGGGGGAGDGSMAGLERSKAGAVVGFGALGASERRGLDESIGRIFLCSSSVGWAGNGVVAVGWPGGGGGDHAAGSAGGGVWLMGFCGEVGGDRRAVGVWGPIRNRGVAGGGVVEWGMVLRWGVDPFERR